MTTSAGSASVNIKPDLSGFLVSLSSGISKAFGKVGDLPALHTFEKRLSGVGKGFAGTLTKTVTLPFLAVGGAAIASALQVEHAQFTIRRATGATGAALKGLEEDFQAVGKQTGASFTTIAEVLSKVSQRLGLTGKPLQELTLTIIRLNKVTDGAAPSVETITKLFALWSVRTKDQISTLDRLFRATQKSGVPLNDLVDTLQRFGPQLRTLGFSLDTATALLASLSKAGVDAGQVMGGLRSFFTKVAKSGQDPAKAFAEVIAKLRELQLAGKQTEAFQLGQKLFGSRGAGLARAARDGKLAYADFLNTIQSGGDTIRTAAKSTLSFADRLARFKNQATLALAPLGEKLFPVLEKTLNAILPPLTKFLSVLGHVPGPVLAIVAAFAVLGPVIPLILKIVTAVAGLKTAVAGAGTTAAAAGQQLTLFGGEAAALSIGPLAILATGVAAVAGFYLLLRRRVDATGEGLAKFRKATIDLAAAQQAELATNKQVEAAQKRVNDLRATGKTNTDQYRQAIDSLAIAEQAHERATEQDFAAQRARIDAIGKTFEKVFKPGLLDRFSASRAPDVLRQLAKAVGDLAKAGVPLETMLEQINHLKIRDDQKNQLKALATGYFKLATQIEQTRKLAEQGLGLPIAIAKDEKAFQGQIKLVDGLIASYSKLGPDAAASSNKVSDALKELIRLTANHALGLAREQTALGKTTDAHQELLKELNALKARYPDLSHQIDTYIQRIFAQEQADRKRAEGLNTVASALKRIRDFRDADLAKKIEVKLSGLIDGAFTDFKAVENRLRAIKNLSPTIRKQILAKLRVEIAIQARLQLQSISSSSTANQRNERTSGVGKAGGGTVAKGQWSWVGEKGPELVHFDAAARVFSHEDSLRMTRNQPLNALRGSETAQAADTWNITINNPKPESLALSLPAARRRAELFRARG